MPDTMQPRKPVDTDRWSRLQQLFEGAIEVPPERRKEWLAGACPDDEELLRQAESLILHDGEPTSVGTAIRDVASSFSGAAEPAPGDRLGAYRIVKLLGRGGMGAVFLAERDDEQFDQTVAIKLVRSNLPTPEMLARFKAERQILATLDHPHIARLLDGGAAPNGTPYFVIEYVDGMAITEYCRKHNLTIDERVRLLRKVCSAVQYSHQNLIVHRDLKPSNILVTNEGEPKLLDFGIAKLLDPAAALETHSRVRLMTPDYASPEQVRGEPVTTATDVYALGVLLFELLTGERPYQVPADSYAMEQAICTEEPTRPSAFRRELRGDLENIVLTAMRKDPSRRYASAEQLSEDLRRYLEGFPVLARQDTWRYRSAKFVRRNRVAVAAATTVLLLIVGFAVTMTVQANLIARERDRASLEQRKAQQVAAFLTDLFRVADPSQNRGETITAREILDQGAARIETELAAQPRVQATMMNEIGGIYANLGLYREARKLMEKGLAIRRRVLGPKDPEVAASLQSLSLVLRDLGEYDSALEHARQSVALRRELLGDKDPRLVPSLNALAVLLEDKADYQQSEKLHRESVALLRSQPEPDLTALAHSLNNLAGVLRRLGKDTEAVPMMIEVLDLRRGILGNDHPDVTKAQNNLAIYYLDRGELQRAEKEFREVVAVRRRVLGADHPEVAKALTNLAQPLIQQKRLDEAVVLLNEALEIFRNRFGDKHLNVAFVQDSLANVLYEKRDFAAAGVLYRHSMDMFRERFGDDHPEVAVSYYNLAGNFEASENYAEAEQYARKAESVYRVKLGAENPKRLQALVRLGDVLNSAGKPAAAEAAYREAIELGQNTWRAEDEDRAAALAGLGGVLTEAGKAREAEPLLREALEVRRKHLPQGDIRVAYSENLLGDCLRSLGRYSEAEPLLSRSLAAIRAQEGNKSPKTRLALARLARFDEAQQTPARAEPLEVHKTATQTAQ